MFKDQKVSGPAIGSKWESEKMVLMTQQGTNSEGLVRSLDILPVETYLRKILLLKWPTDSLTSIEKEGSTHLLNQ